MNVAAAISPAQAPRLFSRGFYLPAIPAAPAPASPVGDNADPVAAVEMPAGYRLEDRCGGLQLIRERDGEPLGIMSSPGLAARHAAALARIESIRA